jgi:16S rRNA (guanine(966)-N(2))-methyltransferase RsmD
VSFLRITSGALRGRRIAVPKGDVRPTSERARQAYFNIVHERLPGARFLDLFAGSGIFSFEAISRGAKEAVAVDSSRAATAAIDREARALETPVRTITADALAGIKRLRGEVLDVIYADPPYDYDGYDDLLMAIDTELTLADEAMVAIEHRGPRSRPGERLGFLPGDMREKVDPYLRPLYDALYDLMDRKHRERAIERGRSTIEIAPLAFMRGRTLNARSSSSTRRRTRPDADEDVPHAARLRLQGVVTGDVTQIDERMKPSFGVKFICVISSSGRETWGTFESSSP